LFKYICKLFLNQHMLNIKGLK